MAKKNKRFSYKPRFQDTVADKQQDDIQEKWQNLKASRKRKKKFLTTPLFLVLFLIAVLVVFYVLSRYE